MATAEHESSDVQRMAAWVRDHGAAVRGYLRAVLRRADEADDLTQEVFCRAWQNRGRYQEMGHARAYLLRIAERLTYDRTRRRRPETSLDQTVWHVVVSEGDTGIHHAPRDVPLTRSVRSTIGDPADRAMAAESAERLTAALDRLTPIQQRVLLLRYYGQLTFNEIAETLGCRLNTVLSHCHRGLKALRKHLPEEKP